MSKNTLYLKELNELNKAVFNSSKSIWKSYILTLLLGWAGVHWIYLENKRLSIIRISYTTVTSILAIILFFYSPTENALLQMATLSLAITIVWSIVDLFLIGDYLENEARTQEETLKKQFLKERNE